MVVEPQFGCIMCVMPVLLDCAACQTLLCVVSRIVPLVNLVVLGLIYWRVVRDHRP